MNAGDFTTKTPRHQGEGMLAKGIQGRFAAWRKGTRVRVEGSGQFVTIHRVKKHGQTELMNTMVCVPRGLIRFEGGSDV